MTLKTAALTASLKGEKNFAMFCKTNVLEATDMHSENW